MKLDGEICVWFLPDSNQPIARSGKLVYNLIESLATHYSTIRKVRNAILYNEQAKAILDIYIANGYENDEPCKIFGLLYE